LRQHFANVLILFLGRNAGALVVDRRMVGAPEKFLA
jgi:hypothetical protein